MTLTLLYSPFPTREAARAAAASLLEARLVACCNILPAGESHYWWQGVLTRADEVILIAKTTASHAEAARQLLESLHPYECPAILTLGADATHAFAAWVNAETTPAKNSDKGD